MKTKHKKLKLNNKKSEIKKKKITSLIYKLKWINRKKEIIQKDRKQGRHHE